MKPFLILIFMLEISTVLFAQMLAISDHNLIETSENIVRGKVQSTEAKWVNNNQLIYTFTKIKITESIEGKYKKGEIVTVVAPGGYDPIRDIGMNVSHQALFETGEDVLVFLVKAEGDIDAVDYSFLKNEPSVPKNIMRVNGYFQGKRKIFEDPHTKKLMIHKPNENRTIELVSHQKSMIQELKHVHQ